MERGFALLPCIAVGVDMYCWDMYCLRKHGSPKGFSSLLGLVGLYLKGLQAVFKRRLFCFMASMWPGA